MNDPRLGAGPIDVGSNGDDDGFPPELFVLIVCLGLFAGAVIYAIASR